jgi:thiol-disulfide isomerase/thioredoxin
MKRLTTFVATVLLAAPVMAQDAAEKQASPASAEKKPAVTIGSVVDEKLTLTDLDGKTMTFKDLREKVVLIHFWSKDCPFEVVADPKVAALEKSWKDKKDVVVLAINANSTEIGDAPPADGYKAIKEHLKQKGLTSKVYVDHGNKLADLFGARSTPHCFVLDRKGTLVYEGGLDDDPKGDKGEAAKQYARDAVEAVLAGKEVTVKQSKPYGCSIKRIKI